MVKGIITFISLALLVALMIFNTPVTRVGSGFMIGDGRHVITYTGLVHEAQFITVKFPNEDDIKAQSIYADPVNNIALLKLDQPPKVKRTPLVFSNSVPPHRDNYVFTLGYPWTNTQEDQHRLIEGSLNFSNTSSTNLLYLKMPLEPVHSGSPLLNTKGEIIGMLLMSQHLDGLNGDSGEFNHAVGVKVLKQALEKRSLYEEALSKPIQGNAQTPAYIESIKNNIVLIEAD